MTDEPQTEAEKIQFAIDTYIKLYQQQHDVYVEAKAKILAAVEEAKEWNDEIPADVTPEMMGTLNAYFGAYGRKAYEVLNQDFVGAYNTKLRDLKANDEEGFRRLVGTARELGFGLQSAVSSSQPVMGVLQISLKKDDPLHEVKVIIINVMAGEDDKVGLAKDLPYDYYFNAAIVPFPTGSLREEFNSNGAVVESFTPYGEEIKPAIFTYKPNSEGLKDLLFSGYMRMPGQPLQIMEFPPMQIQIGEVRPSGLVADDDLDGPQPR